MSSRKWSVGVLALAVWGCGPPEIVQVTPPGTELPHVVSEEDSAQALGEQLNQGNVAPPDATTTPAPSAGTAPAAAPAPAAK